MVVMKLAKMFLLPKGTGLIRYIPYLFIIPVIVFHALALTGCVSTSPGIPNIYVVSLRSAELANSNNTDLDVQVRIGYFGMCGISEDHTLCGTVSGRDVEDLSATLFPAATASNNTLLKNEITDLITTAQDLQTEIFISILAGAAVLFIVGLVALFFFKRDRKKNGVEWYEQGKWSKIVKRGTYGALFLSAAMTFASALATSQSAGALQITSAVMENASVLIKTGTTIQVFQWIAFGFGFSFAAVVPFLAKPSGSGEEYVDKEGNAV
ncbi:Ca2+ regulator and membrane fusion protein Fig1-domain-containing protein [Triangularia verruculosa]|uniref:Ca2+ regulator and membrane fusion protein Fig1-domain-containing protein n=1 Tax=Triangularia verruculosa TaxID=2587418 RepID=A0AAN6XEN4_9PEZI|nr:Ca2+ regulator and membrane fusion protein Fig1-domain-containing protein [Triangularia verruculosa]